MMDFYEEKRKYPRIDVSVPVKISTIRGGAVLPVTCSSTYNMSEGGVCSHVPQFIQMAKRLLVEMEIPGTGSITNAIAKVAWIGKEPSEDGYRVGLQFLETGKKDRAAIKSYMDSLIA